MIQEIDIENADLSVFEARFADCIILDQLGQILLQQKPDYWDHFPGYVMAFGGHVEDGEMPVQGCIREIKEELGADIAAGELRFLGAVSEAVFDHKDILHLYFWHDVEGRITGCYEGEAKVLGSVEDVLAHPKIMDYLPWALRRCQEKGYL